MIRGHLFSSLVLSALFAAAVAAAQGPSTAAPAAPAPEQPVITTTETVVVTAPGEFRVEQELQAPALIEEAPGTSPIKSHRAAAQRQLPGRRSLRLLRVGSAHLGARLQSESARLHARRHSAGRYVLRQLERPAHQPRHHRREHRPHRSFAGHRRAGDRLHQQPGRNHPVLLRRSLRQAQLSP